MSKTNPKQERRARAHRRVRGKVKGTPERPRLTVYKSLRYVYAQLIDDEAGRTLTQASSQEPELRSRIEGGANGRQAAKLVGQTIGERAREQGIRKAVFDRSGYVYHGRVRELADGARESGLEF